jgi:hypothetical protein
MLQRPGGISASRAPYVPNVAASRGVYRSSYVRPTGRYGYRPRLPPPVVPAGRAPGGAGLLAAILGPIGGLTGCLCCLNTIGIWGLFITAIPLTVYISRWTSAYKGLVSSAPSDILASQFLLIFVLVCSFLFTFMRRS